ncbi:22100_t:CDS:1, partial [Gigaspora rosea]
MNHLGFLPCLDWFLQSLSCDYVINSDPSVLISWAVVNKFSLFSSFAVFRLKTFPRTTFSGAPPCSICQSSDKKLKWNFNSSALSRPSMR